MVFLFIIFLISCFSLSADPVEVHVNAQQNAAMKLMIIPLGKQDQMNDTIALISKALMFKGQFAVDIRPSAHILPKQELLDLRKSGYPLLVFIEMPDKNTLQWRLYDTQNAQMLKGKKMSNQSSGSRGLAYATADSLWQELAGEPGFFSTKIAYCKEVTKNKKRYKHIFVADYDGSNEQVLVQTPTINIAPRWNKDARKPLLFYSESTNANIRMMAASLKKERIMASNFDGLNMLPTFSSDGKTVIYCATRGAGNCQLYQWRNRELKRLTNNVGNNFSPILSHDDKTLFFSSDFETGSPQIYSYDMQTEMLERLTSGGYCVSPSYCKRSGLLSYSKMVNGVMQLFSYNLATKEHAQLTSDAAQKEECAWSECGTYLMCPVDTGKTSRIALFNRITKEYTFLTDSKDRCSYPAWSGIYNDYPIVS